MEQGSAASRHISAISSDMGVLLKMVSTPTPTGFADHYPYEMAISLGIYPTFSDKPICSRGGV